MKKTLITLSIFMAARLGCTFLPISPTKYFSERGQRNAAVALWLPFGPKRGATAYLHTLNGFPRTRSDCKPHCPKVDIWQYQYRPGNTPTIVDTKPIASRKTYWKATDEARIIAISLFGGLKLYEDALLDFADSFAHIKHVNRIADPLWGYETFTVRVYVSKRNPANEALGPFEGDTSDEMIEHFLARGFEVALVDNGLKKAGKDATFWRFMVAAEEMPEGQRIRYLSRDADAILSAGEAFSVGEWMSSGLAHHRMHILPVCMGPLTAMVWGGSHTGKGTFADMKTLIEYYPYRLQYGDDELFTRDMVWPRIKAEGSVMTHLYPRGLVFAIANPYQGSCEEPTQSFCDEIRDGGHCPDVIMPDYIKSPLKALGLRGTLAELRRQPELFNLHGETPRGARAIKALSVGH